MEGPTERCVQCGTPSVAGGRFCINCGAQLGTEATNPRVMPSPTDTAERVYDLPATAYAGSAVAPGAPPPPIPLTDAPLAGETSHLHREPRRRQAGAGLWVAVVAAMVVVLVLGGFLLLHGSGGTGGDTSGKTPPLVPKTHRDTTSGSGPSSGSSTGDPSSPTTSPSRVKGPPTNVAGFAKASAPRHLPSGVDFDGRPVSYDASNLVDGRNDTCWRVAGDATGTVLTFKLDQPTRLLRVGLVNGYSKIAYSHNKPFDWYLGNRRVLAVQWLFDDGSKVSQRFGSNRAIQQVAVKPTTTDVVRLRITKVSAPGKGRAARNDTAISEVLLLGRTG